MTILITGASSGIGYATAESLIGQNHIVIAIARNTEKLKALQDKALAIGKAQLLKIIGVDINNDSQLDLLKPVLDKTGLDILINNAGELINKPFESLARQDWYNVYNTNVFSLAQLTKMCIPYLLNSGNAHILNITSIGGVQGSSKFSGLSAYSSSKGAVSILTECLATELKDRNISVNALALGAVDTPMLQQAFPGYKAPINSETMSDFITWFALNGQKFFNGKVLPVSTSNP